MFGIIALITARAMTSDGALPAPAYAGPLDQVAFEGCGPGYWKQPQHRDSWPATGYAPGQTVGSVFTGSTSVGLQQVTLLQALVFQGGGDTNAAASILLKAAVAALLNSAHPQVDYPLSTSDVISRVNAALSSQDRSTILALAAELERLNDLGCPLN